MNHAQHIADGWLEGWADKFRREAEYYLDNITDDLTLKHTGSPPKLDIVLAAQYVARQLNECAALLEGARLKLLTDEQLIKE